MNMKALRQILQMIRPAPVSDYAASRLAFVATLASKWSAL
jgi:hypothetical protein